MHKIKMIFPHVMQPYMRDPTIQQRIFYSLARTLLWRGPSSFSTPTNWITILSSLLSDGGRSSIVLTNIFWQEKQTRRSQHLWRGTSSGARFVSFLCNATEARSHTSDRHNVLTHRPVKLVVVTEHVTGVSDPVGAQLTVDLPL